MHSKFAHKLEEWLLPRGRTLLVGLFVANLALAAALVGTREPAEIAAAVPAVVQEESPNIQLLAEVSASPPAAAQPAAMQCRIWGPEQTPDAFDNLIVELESSGSFPEVQPLEIKAASDYLVFIGELGSRDNAKRIAKELNALKIDSYLINRKDSPLMLSVGVFSRQSLAQRQHNRIDELGYAVEIEELERSQTVYQLSAHVPEGSPAYKSSTSACIAIAHNT